MRRISVLIPAFVVLVWLLTPGRAFADSTISVSSPTTVSQGSTFAVDVNISGAADLYALQLDLTFNPSVLAVTGVTEGSFLPGGGATFFIPGTIDNVGGSVTNNADTLLTAISGVNGDGTLLVFDFTALAAGTSALDLANITLLDSGLNIISNFTSTDGSVTVTGGGPVPTPEPSSSLLFAVGALVLVTVAARQRQAD